MHPQKISKLKSLIFSVESTGGKRITRVFGLPIIVSINTPNIRDRRILGISLSKKKTTRRYVKHYVFGCQIYCTLNIKSMDDQLKSVLSLASNINYKLSKIASITGAPTEMDRKLSNMESLVEVQTEMNRKLSNMKYIIEAQTLHTKTFAPYKNAFKDRNVVLVCTGPSAKYYEPIEGAIHVGVNGAIYLEGLKLDYLFVQDYTIHQTGNETLVEDALIYQGNSCKKFFGIMPSERLAQIKKHIGRIPLRYADGFNISQYLLEDIMFHEIAYDLAREPLGEFGGTVFSTLQFILYTNPKTLYIVGWDCSSGYAYNKSQFFCPADYQLEILKKHFIPFIEDQHSDMKIVTINPVGLKGLFSDLYTERYLRDHPGIEGCISPPASS